jgi:hypothetical protein
MNAMKTELSPAAQAVLDAYMTGYGWLDGPWHKDCLGVAAALRAAADHLDAESPWPGRIESTGVNWSRNELHKIATELEAQP